MERYGHCLFEILEQPVDFVVIEEKSNRSKIHAVDGHGPVNASVQCLQHETISAEGHEDIGLVGRHVWIGCRKLLQRGLRFGRPGGSKSDLVKPRHEGIRLSRPPQASYSVLSSCPMAGQGCARSCLPGGFTRRPPAARLAGTEEQNRGGGSRGGG